jgi:antitoxin HicB
MAWKETVTTHEYRYTVILEPQDEGGFLVRVPKLPEVVTTGETEDEAIQMAEDAIRLVVEYRREHGEPIPTDTFEPRTKVREVKIAVSI